MHTNNNQVLEAGTAQMAVPWGAAFGYPDRGRPRRSDVSTDSGPSGDQPGSDLLAFLTDFRTAREEAADDARREAAERAGRARGSASRRTGGGPAGAGGQETRDDPYQGSDVQPAPDWWLATDGRWYRPELHPDARAVPGAGGPGHQIADWQPSRSGGGC